MKKQDFLDRTEQAYLNLDAEKSASVSVSAHTSKSSGTIDIGLPLALETAIRVDGAAKSMTETAGRSIGQMRRR